MRRYEDLVDYAETIVNIVNNQYKKGNTMAYLALLSGLGAYKIESFTGAGHNYQAVIDAIHNCYKRTGDEKLIAGYQEGLDGMIRVAVKFSSLQLLVNILFYEHKLEMSGKAAFHVNIDPLVCKVKDLIAKNSSKYQTEYSGFDSWLEQIRSV